MFKEKLNVEILNSKCCDDGRILLLNVKIHDEVYCLTNIYAPNSEIERKTIFTTVENWLQNHSVNVTQIIIGGDFNCCLLDNDREPKTHLRDASKKVLLFLFYFGFYVAFNTVQVISRRVVGRAEETST